jgi:hypothetical protein
MTNIYRVAYRQIDGVIEDRETALPALKLEMHPIGTELPKDKQERELVLKIGLKETRIGPAGIAELHEFLTVKP